MSRKDEIKEQLVLTDKAIRDLRQKLKKLIEDNQPTDEVKNEIDQLVAKVMDLSLQYTKY